MRDCLSQSRAALIVLSAARLHANVADSEAVRILNVQANNKNIDGALDILGFQTTFVARGARVPSLQQAKFLASLLAKQKNPINVTPDSIIANYTADEAKVKITALKIEQGEP